MWTATPRGIIGSGLARGTGVVSQFQPRDSVKRREVVCVCCVLVSACVGGSSGAGPAGPTPPSPASGTLSGRVTETAGGSVYPIAGAVVTIVDGADAGKATTTNAIGVYSLAGLRLERFDISISATGFTTGTFPVDLTANRTHDFTLESSVPRRPFGAGLYKIGVDIPAGRYFSDPLQSGCYWERQRGSSGTLSDIITNRAVTYDAAQYIVDILAFDVAFKTDAKCGTWLDSPPHGELSSIRPGVWLVGSQIAPGTYETRRTSGATGNVCGTSSTRA